MLHDVESPEQARRYQEALEAAVIEQRPGLAEDRAGLEKVIEQGFSDLTGGRYDTDEAVLVGQAARKALEAAADGAGDGTPPHAGQA
ncbi:hypothetical protein, partial [Calidithermus chliarophilus]|uniref:hypothetical protein n=1 Tax=Calidithermus chliarophilus TaxID=52023 RepID=UPI00056B2F08